jgi:hypothetical protein
MRLNIYKTEDVHVMRVTCPGVFECLQINMSVGIDTICNPPLSFFLSFFLSCFLSPLFWKNKRLTMEHSALKCMAKATQSIQLRSLVEMCQSKSKSVVTEWGIVKANSFWEVKQKKL